MANKFNGFLQDLLTGFLYPKGNMADFQHAARLYVDDTFRLAPKNKFLYYAVFNIANNVLSDTAFQDRHRLELNYLVKKMDLPKYTLDTTTLNQYNRKTTVYTKITYEPITITLHDDNNGVTNGLWALYYGYYFADRLNAGDPYSGISPAAYSLNTYDAKDGQPFRYGLDNDSFGRFFDSIQLFTLSRHRFTSYTLCNPKITAWQHDQLDQMDGSGVLENTMTLAYDAVLYNSGLVEVDDPTGFAVLHYDTIPSPIGNDFIIENGSEGIFGDLFGLSAFAGTSSFLDTVRDSLLYYNNVGNRRPVSYGAPNLSAYGYQATPYYTGGFQNYNFGGYGYNTQFPYNPSVVAAGIGLAGVAVNGIGQVISGIGNGIGNLFGGNNPASDAAAARVSNISNSVAGVSGSNAFSDVYGPQLPQAYGPQLPDNWTGSEAGYSGEAGAILQESLAFSNPSLPDNTAEILANSNFGSGDAALDVGSPFG